MPKRFRITIALIPLIAAYLGWIYYSRWSREQSMLEQVQERKAAQTGNISDIYGDGSVKILMFYPVPPSIRPGETAQVCYGVASAESVRIEPPIGDIWPSASRCVEVSPKEDTVYKLTAEDSQGNSVTAETAVNVLQ